MANSAKSEKARFEAVYPVLRDELLDYMKRGGLPPDTIAWFQRNLDYNVPGGKLNRGLSVVDTVRILQGRELTDEDHFNASLLGWCIELLQAYLLVTDDIMDRSVTRRGQPCYYRIEEVGLIAINDACMLEGAIYYLLKKYIRAEPYYVDVLELFHDTTFKTEIGQLIDLTTASETHVDLSKFSLEKHRKIVVYKTAYYSFYLPVALAMHMCRIPSPSTSPTSTPPPESDPYALAQSILIPLGEYFQVQDDFLDYAAPPAVLGKLGTDIVDNKCSWCIATALALATPAQRAVLDANYGRKEARRERRVKEVYGELGIGERYEAYEREACARVLGLIERVPEVPDGPVRGGPVVLRREVFVAFLDKIYKRQK